jgi:DnaJ-class molecular chaperone
MKDDYDHSLEEGNVWCDLCQGDGFRYVTLDDALGDIEETCPVCEGEGQITRGRAQKRDAARKEMSQALGKALLSARKDTQ